MLLDRDVLTALWVAGVMWVGLVCVLTLMSSLAVIAGAVVYVAVFGAAIAWRRVPTGASVFVAWMAVVVAVCAVMSPMGSENEVVAVLLMGGMLGTFLFVAWMVPAFVVLLMIDPEMRKVTD